MLCLQHLGAWWLLCRRPRCWFMVSSVPARFPSRQGQAGLLPTGAASPSLPGWGGRRAAGPCLSWLLQGQGAEPCILLHLMQSCCNLLSKAIGKEGTNLHAHL